MCAICRLDICPSACPSYEGYELERGRPKGQCEECGAYIYAEEGEEESGLWLCAECAADR